MQILNRNANIFRGVFVVTYDDILYPNYELTVMFLLCYGTRTNIITSNYIPVSNVI